MTDQVAMVSWLLNVLGGAALAVVLYGAVTRWSRASPSMGRLAAATAAAGVVAGLMLYVVRVLSRALSDYRTDLYPIGAMAWSGLFLAVLVARRSASARFRRGLVTFLVFSVSSILAASLALFLLVRGGFARF